jgi:cellobiose phosphorylase
MRMLNPIHHSNSDAALACYKVEPYVLAADVYAVAPHLGRGGWTWYTGSAAWMLRLMWESLLGLEIQDYQLKIHPHIPKDWDSFSLNYRYRSTTYEITVQKTSFAGTGLSLDKVPQKNPWITMVDDGKTHQVMLLFSAS